MIRALHLILGIVLIGCLVPLPAAPVQAQELTTVRYAVSPFQDTLLPIIGEEMGWYEEEGLDVEFIILGWTEVQEALAAGQADVAINNISSVIATHQQWSQAWPYDIKAFVRAVGAERLMYGSDAPFQSPKVERVKVEECRFTDQELDLIFHENAKRIWGFDA
jgi:ABC-type nitrate/sulfonate/bicarbonate transport system substrate-binding protein